MAPPSGSRISQPIAGILSLLSLFLMIRYYSTCPRVISSQQPDNLHPFPPLFCLFCGVGRGQARSLRTRLLRLICIALRQGNYANHTKTEKAELRTGLIILAIYICICNYYSVHATHHIYKDYTIDPMPTTQIPATTRLIHGVSS